MFPPAAVQLTPVHLSYLPNSRPGAVVIHAPYYHVPQSCSHLPLRRGSLRQRLDCSGRPLSCSRARLCVSQIVFYHILPRSDLDLLQQSKNSMPGCSSASLHTTCSRVSPNHLRSAATRRALRYIGIRDNHFNIGKSRLHIDVATAIEYITKYL